MPDGLDASMHNMPEYFDCAVRLSVLTSFFDAMPDTVVQHKLCDLAFCFVVTNHRQCVRFMPGERHAGAADRDDFVYFYDRGAQPGGMSNEVIPLPKEEAAEEGP